MTHHSRHKPHAHGHHAAFDDEQFAAILEAEGEIAAGLADQALDRCWELLAAAGTSEVGRVVDLGCGPGVATAQIAQRFESARVVGVDQSAVMLEHSRDRAVRCGVSDRVELRALDLDSDLALLGSFDIVWCSMTLHHAVDEAAALRRFAALIGPGGVLCLLERAAPMMVRPTSDLGRPGIWDRVGSGHEHWQEKSGASPPGLAQGTRYAELIEAAGLTVLDAQFISDTVQVASAQARLLLDRHFATILRDVGASLIPSDRDALSEAVKSATATQWGQVMITSGRSLFIASLVGCDERV